jgi:hypothetical protein
MNAFEGFNRQPRFIVSPTPSSIVALDTLDDFRWMAVFLVILDIFIDF